MTILVTGALGFIGSNLVPKLLNQGHSVIGFDNLSNVNPDATSRMKKEAGDNWSKFEFFKMDIREFDSMHAICTKFDIRTIIHLAAMGSVPRSFLKPADYVDVNEKGFVNICRLASHLAITRIVYASSSSVYGHQTDKCEDKPCDPASPYAVGKMQNELFAKTWAMHTAIQMIGLRFFNVYGPGQSALSEYSAVIPRFICNPSPIVNGDGYIERDFTYVDDVCEAIKLAAFDKLSLMNEVFNVGTGKKNTLKSLISILGKEKSVVYGDKRIGDVKSSRADTLKAMTILGFTAKISIVDGLRKTVEYFREVENGRKSESSAQIPERA